MYSNAVIARSPKKTQCFVTRHFYGREQLVYKRVFDKNYIESLNR